MRPMPCLNVTAPTLMSSLFSLTFAASRLRVRNNTIPFLSAIHRKFGPLYHAHCIIPYPILSPSKRMPPSPELKQIPPGAASALSYPASRRARRLPIARRTASSLIKASMAINRLLWRVICHITALFAKSCELKILTYKVPERFFTGLSPDDPPRRFVP